MEEEENREN